MLKICAILRKPDHMILKFNLFSLKLRKILQFGTCSFRVISSCKLFLQTTRETTSDVISHLESKFWQKKQETVGK